MNLLKHTCLVRNCTLLAVATVVSVGCSSDDSTINLQDDPQQPGDPLPVNGNPFTMPDPNGATTLARLGYADTRELADELVSMSYLRRYYDLDSVIAALLQGGELASGVTIDCPAGGNAVGDQSPLTFDVVFENCAVAGHTLSGGLARDADFTVFGLGDSQVVKVTFNRLTITAGELGTLELTGVSTRSDRNSASTACSGAPAIFHEVANRIDMARISNGALETSITDATWNQITFSESQAPSGNPTDDCLLTHELRFTGTTTVVSSTFNGTTVEIEKNGDITRLGAEQIADPNSDSFAALAADLGDGSTLTLTMTSDADSEVQVDLVSGNVVTSFTDNYGFNARADIPPILSP